MRIKGIITYKGTQFYGYQIQKDEHQRSVQKDIQDVLKRIFSQEIKIYSSGRTDRGVHALGQVIHFDIDKDVDLYKLKHSLNCLLPNDIHFISLEKVDEEFHARFSALSKQYRYIVNIGEYDPINDDCIFNLNQELDIERIKEAMELFVGEHNFINFCANDDEDYVRNISSFTVRREENHFVFDVIGNGFRRYMVRMIMGTLFEVGKNKVTIEQVKEILKGDTFERVSYKAPSNGLYLVKVNY